MPAKLRRKSTAFHPSKEDTMTDRSVKHDTFVIERSYPVPPAKAFAAWADPKIKSRWFGDPNSPSQIFEFKVGGREYAASDGPGGQNFVFDVTYQDIVPDQRIVYTYQMEMGGKRISVSVASIEFKPEGKGTRMVLTEAGAFLDGLDTSAQREAGTRFLVDALGKELERQAAA
jgi:uncharacterized protein YndB with AHSA1/START domain